MRNKRSWFAVPYVIWMALFVVIPIVIMAVYAFTAADPATNDTQATLDNFTGMGLYLNVFLRSFWLAILATLVCLLIGYPVSYWMAKEGPRFQRLAMALIMLPMWMNFLLRTLAWQTLLEKTGVINSILNILHLPSLDIINTPYAIVLGMVYNFLPFMVLPIYNSLCKIDADIVSAARDLGANAFQTFIKITLPLTVPGIISGITMVFVPALTTFVISDLLGGGKILLIGNVIEQAFKQSSSWNVGSGLSLVLMIFIIASMAIVAKYDKDGEGTAF